MDLWQEMAHIVRTGQALEESKNYYYERHQCAVKGEEVKVPLRYQLKDTDTKDIILFGQCTHCQKIYFHTDYDSE